MSLVLLKPEPGTSDLGQGEEVAGGLFEARRDSAEVLQSMKEALEKIALCSNRPAKTVVTARDDGDQFAAAQAPGSRSSMALAG